MRDKIEKGLHAGSIAAAIGTAATAADLSLFGGAGTAIAVALSSLSIFKKADNGTKDLASAMAPAMVDALQSAPLSQDQKKVVLQLLKDHQITFADISQGDHSADRIASHVRDRLADTLTDPAQTTQPVLSTYQSVLATALEQVIFPTDQVQADTAEILQRLRADGEYERMSKEGITEKAIMRLARRVVTEAPDLNAAWTAIEDAVTVAIRVQQQGNAPSNHRDFVDEVVRRTAEMAAEGEYTQALDQITSALEEGEAQKARLLARGLDMAKLAGDVRQAATLAVEQMMQKAPDDAFEALRALQEGWYVKGRDKGLPFEARVAIHLARSSVSRAASPDQRGAAQNDLGLALQTLGERESGTKRLEEAVTAYRAALEEYTRDRVPLDWAGTQNNLGNALATLGERESSTKRLEEAVSAYRAALEERTRDRVPLDWAMTQNNLGNALQTLGDRETGTQRLEEAITSYRAALEEYTRDHVPLDWAMTQNNLGSALRSLGERESGTKRLEEAVSAYRAALEERTRDRAPLGWATTQNNLGTALTTLGERENGTKRLEEAITSYRAALEEYTRDHVPLDWATTQNNLGAALKTLGERESGTKQLKEAVTAYRAALEERTRDRVPLDWAGTHLNLASLELAFFDKTGDAAHLENAHKYVEAAREVFLEGGATHYLEMCDNLLAAIQSRREG